MQLLNTADQAALSCGMSVPESRGSEFPEPTRSTPPHYFDLLRRFLQELKSVAVDRDAPFVASRARLSDVVCSFGSTLE